jgi:phosphate transport system permease protein
MAQPLPRGPSGDVPRRRIPPGELSAAIQAARVREPRGRRRVDALARVVISAGGLAILVSVLAIVAFIAREFLPLFADARASPPLRLDRPPGAPPALAAGVEDYRRLAFLVTGAGAVELWDLLTKRKTRELPVDGLGGATVTAASLGPRLDLALGTSDGRILGTRLGVEIDYTPDLERTLDVRLEAPAVLAVDPRRRPLTRAYYRRGEDGQGVAVGSTGPGSLVVARVSAGKKGLLDEGPARTVVARTDLSGELPADLTAVAVEWDGEGLVAGFANGEALRWDLRGESPERVARFRAAPEGTAVTALGFLIGDQSVVSGDAAGGVSTFMAVRDAQAPGGWTTRQVHVLSAHESAVTAVSPSRRDKGFVTGSAGGTVALHHATSEQTLLRLSGVPGPVRQLVFAPRADGVVALPEGGGLVAWGVSNPHPEVTWRTLFGKVWYEGYPEPAYVWQSTGGTDDFEPKFSLVPLIFGTLKGTVYALLFAVPIATLAALYTSQFAHPSIRNAVKPVIEIMAGLPSVVIGFLAGLYLAPLIQQAVVAVFLLPLVLPAMAVLAMLVWNRLPAGVRGRMRPGAEVMAIIAFILVGVYVAAALGPGVERALFGGDFEQWLLETTGTRYDQRNSLVIGIAMGFAVIPIIFTISEDALSNVPAHLTSASLALGASRWQTALRVVLPTASPGIFSAVMVGFGRAVGETMIVLMATGNTPIMDWSIFNGMRTLSANIAVEIPEAPHGGTLYRVLFLAGGLLFLATFLVNTLAEVVRQRLRQRYAKL